MYFMEVNHRHCEELAFLSVLVDFFFEMNLIQTHSSWQAGVGIIEDVCSIRYCTVQPINQRMPRWLLVEVADELHSPFPRCSPRFPQIFLKVLGGFRYFSLPDLEEHQAQTKIWMVRLLS